MDHYFAKLQPDGPGFLLTFLDIPEAITGGATREEAVANAAEALELALLTYVSDGREMPVTSTRASLGKTLVQVPVPASLSAKIAFIENFRKSGLTRVALAKRLGKAETEVRRMLDPYHQTKLPALEAGLRALGKRLVVRVEEAA